jgi:glyoxylate/hydroxypyruvate reductase
MAILISTFPQPGEAIVAAVRERAAGEIVFDQATQADVVPDDQVEVLVAFRLKPGQLAKYPNLKLIYVSAAGVEKVIGVPDLPAHIQVVRTVDPGQNLQMAQYAVMLALHFLRGMPRFVKQQAERQWIRYEPPLAAECPVTILGMGPSGKRIAQAFSQMGFPVSGWSRTRHEEPGVRSFAGMGELPAALARAKVVVCILPLTAHTRHVLNADTLAMLPKGAYLINVARGDHVDEVALLAALESGQLGGAAIDVQAREPLPADSPLWSAPNLTITPHIAAYPSPALVAEQLLENVRRLRAGEPLQNLVDRTRGY